MRISLRFVIPLAVALAAIAYAVVPLVDNLTLKWFVRDLDIRTKLIATAVQEPFVELLTERTRDKVRLERVQAFFNRILQDERPRPLQDPGTAAVKPRRVAARLDGLATGPVVIALFAYAGLAYVAGNAVYSRYLGFPLVPGAGELTVICAAVAGAGLAFLWFNAYPAEVFMGDVGALALGAALGTIAVVVRQEIVLFIMGGVFVVETLSVVLQVASFKLTGRRVFRMAPLHHHYELKGWKENQVVVRFWIITMMLVLVGISTLKLR